LQPEIKKGVGPFCTNLGVVLPAAVTSVAAVAAGLVLGVEQRRHLLIGVSVVDFDHPKEKNLKNNPIKCDSLHKMTRDGSNLLLVYTRKEFDTAVNALVLDGGF
jgi:hypothetical protein